MLKTTSVAVGLAVIGLAAFGGGCGSDTSEQDLEKARQEGAQQAREQEKLKKLEEQVDELQNQNQSGSGSSGSGGSSGGSGSSSGGGGSSASGPVESCSDTVRVGPNTSCSFAMNVAGEYGSNPGATSTRAFSPATGKFYVLSCSAWSGGGTVCQGGNNAAVYLP